MTTSSPVLTQDIEIDLAKFISLIAINKWKLIFIFIISFILAFLGSQAIPNKYTSSVIVISSKNDNDSALSSLSGGLAGLAGLAGLKGTSNRVERLTLAQLTSKKFIIEFITKNNFNAQLYSKNWDLSKNQWTAPFSNLSAYQLFLQNLKIQKNREHGTIEISFSSHSAKLSKDIMVNLIDSINLYAKSTAQQQSVQNISYLRKKIKEKSSIEMQNTLYKILESELKKQMLINSRQQFALEVIDPAYQPERKSSPQRTLISLAASLIVLILSILVLAFKRQPQQ